MHQPRNVCHEWGAGSGRLQASTCHTPLTLLSNPRSGFSALGHSRMPSSFRQLCRSSRNTHLHEQRRLGGGRAGPCYSLAYSHVLCVDVRIPSADANECKQAGADAGHDLAVNLRAPDSAEYLERVQVCGRTPSEAFTALESRSEQPASASWPLIYCRLILTLACLTRCSTARMPTKGCVNEVRWLLGLYRSDEGRPQLDDRCWKVRRWPALVACPAQCLAASHFTGITNRSTIACSEHDRMQMVNAPRVHLASCSATDDVNSCSRPVAAAEKAMHAMAACLQHSLHSTLHCKLTHAVRYEAVQTRPLSRLCVCDLYTGPSCVATRLSGCTDSACISVFAQR